MNRLELAIAALHQVAIEPGTNPAEEADLKKMMVRLLEIRKARLKRNQP